MSNIKFSPIVQNLRAIAALAVLFHHELLHWLPQYRASYAVLSGGVDVFFVISGFVLWGVTTRCGDGVWSFLSKRLTRIVPLYWLMTTFMLVVMLARPSVLRNSRFELTHVVLSYLFVPSRHPVKGTFEPLLFPGWTLDYQMMFYGIFALALCAPKRFRLGVIVGTILLLVLLGLAFQNAGGQWEFYTDPVILEFAMGVCLGAAVTARRRVSASTAAALVVVGGAMFIAVTLTETVHPRLLALGIPAVLVVSGCALVERAIGPTPTPLGRLLGDASYSIFLVHVPIVSAAFQAWELVTPLHNPVGVAVAIILTWSVSVGVGVGVYLCLERPLINHFRASTRRSRLLVDARQL